MHLNEFFGYQKTIKHKNPQLIPEQKFFKLTTTNTPLFPLYKVFASVSFEVAIDNIKSQSQNFGQNPISGDQFCVCVCVYNFLCKKQTIQKKKKKMYLCKHDDQRNTRVAGHK